MVIYAFNYPQSVEYPKHILFLPILKIRFTQPCSLLISTDFIILTKITAAIRQSKVVARRETKLAALGSQSKQ